jgi:hypothetical protein
MTLLLSDTPLPTTEVALDGLSTWLEEFRTKRASKRLLLPFFDPPVRLADCILNIAAGDIQRRTTSEIIWSSKENDSRLSKPPHKKKKVRRCKSICSLNNIDIKVVEWIPTPANQRGVSQFSAPNFYNYNSEDMLLLPKHMDNRTIRAQHVPQVYMDAKRWQYKCEADDCLQIFERQETRRLHLEISHPEQHLQQASEREKARESDSSITSLSLQERFVNALRAQARSNKDGSRRRQGLPLLSEVSIQGKFVNALRAQARSNKDDSRRHQGLPLLFEVSTGVKEVMTGHDTGTHDNHMSLELARKLGYEVDTEDACKGQFQLPNGKLIEAVGRVTAQVQFAQGAGSKTTSIKCHFNVFSRLALPALIGMAFLDATETLKLYRSRLVTLPADWKRTLRLYGVGSATNQVTCIIAGREVKANADTGSEIALVSGKYAMRLGFLREYSCEELELADGSLEYTSGFVDIQLSIRTPQNDGYKRDNWTTKTVRFHVLENLHLDVILDEVIVDDFEIFQNGIGAIVLATTNITPSLATIIHLRTVEQSISKTPEKIRGWASSLLSITKEKSSTFSFSMFSASLTSYSWTRK